MSYQMFLSQEVKRNLIITNKNVKYQLTEEFPIEVRLREISKLHGIIVVPSLPPKWKYCRY